MSAAKAVMIFGLTLTDQQADIVRPWNGCTTVQDRSSTMIHPFSEWVFPYTTRSAMAGLLERGLQLGVPDRWIQLVVQLTVLVTDDGPKRVPNVPMYGSVGRDTS